MKYEFATKIDQSDVDEFTASCVGRAKTLKPPWVFALEVVMFVAITAVFLSLFEIFHWPTAFFAGGVVLWGCIAVSREQAITYGALKPADGGMVLGEKTVIVSEQGAEERGDSYSQRLGWSGVLAVGESERLIHLYVDSASAILIPLRHIEDEAGFLADIEQWRSSGDQSRTQESSADASHIS